MLDEGSHAVDRRVRFLSLKLDLVQGQPPSWVNLTRATVRQKYNNVLTAIGCRRVVIEEHWYYTANMALMAGGIDNALGQATTFTTNGARTGQGPAG